MRREALGWILAAAVGAATAEPPTESLSLEPGGTATAAGGALTITFVEVSEDSRCPPRETCIREGDAVARFALQSGERGATVELHTAAREPHAAGFAGWRVELVMLGPAPAWAATLAVSPGDAPDAPLQ